MELFAADGHDAGGCERVTGKSGMRPACVPGDQSRPVAWKQRTADGKIWTRSVSGKRRHLREAMTSRLLRLRNFADETVAELGRAFAVPVLFLAAIRHAPQLVDDRQR